MYNNAKFLCVIPARGGSKSIHKKNLQKVGRHSLVGRSILHSLKCRLIDKTVVSTNDDEIKNEAIIYGADVVERPEEISGPLNSTEEAIIHTIRFLKEQKEEYDYVVILQPTSPFRSENLIERCIKKNVDENGDSLVACWKFHNFCFYKVIEDGIWLSTFDYSERPMRQEIPIDGWRFFDAGVVYVTKVPYFLDHQCRIGGKILIENISALENIQIDEQEDLELCQKIANGEIL